jgi:hypothetical protein
VTQLECFRIFGPPGASVLARMKLELEAAAGRKS